MLNGIAMAHGCTLMFEAGPRQELGEEKRYLPCRSLQVSVWQQRACSWSSSAQSGTDTSPQAAK